MKFKIGGKLPYFEGLNQDNELIKSSDFIGKNLIIFFYPKNFTSVCTQEVCSFRDLKSEFSEQNAEIIGISSDSTDSHSDFHNSNKLNYNLISDNKSTISNLFGIKKTLGIIPKRITFVFDENHCFLGEIDALFSHQEHIDFALKMLKI